MEWIGSLAATLVLFLLVVPAVVAVGSVILLGAVSWVFYASPSVARTGFYCPFSKRWVTAAFLTQAASEEPSDVVSCSRFGDEGAVTCAKGCTHLPGRRLYRAPTTVTWPRFPDEDLSRPERARRLGVLAGRDPEDGAVAAAAGADSVDGDDVDPLRRELGHELGPLADSIRAAHQEGALGAGDLPLVLPGHLAEGGRPRGDEVHLGAAPMREAGEGGQVDAGLVELAERARTLPRPVRHHHLEVGHLLDVRHGRLLLETSRSCCFVPCKEDT